MKAVLPSPFEWVDIPAGRVIVETLSPTLDPHTPERHRFEWNVPPFRIAKYPLTNAQYAVFIKAGGYQEQKWWTVQGWQRRETEHWTEPQYWRERRFSGDDQPVVGISWYEAVAFCQWLSEASGEPVMLPTEQQWQRAAQGDDKRAFPWGNEWESARCNNNSAKPHFNDRTTPVTQYPTGASPFGVMDMAGNVDEWCLTTYDYESVHELSRSNTLDGVFGGTDSRVLRGGSWFCGLTDYFRVVYRSGNFPYRRSDGIGFRCIRPY